MPPQILCFVEGKPEPDGPAYAGSSGKRLFACPVDRKQSLCTLLKSMRAFILVFDEAA